MYTIKLALIFFNFLLLDSVVACKPIEPLGIKETILRSEAILIGTAIRFSEKDSVSKVLIEVDNLISGTLHNAQYFMIDGEQVSKSLQNKSSIPFKRKRSTSPGKCFAVDYEYGGQYLFLMKDNTPYWSPLNAVNERVSGNNDPWVQWVKGFLDGVNYKDKRTNQEN